MKSAISAAIALLWSVVFKPALGSINGALIPAELKKAFAAALAAGTVVGGLVSGLNAIVPDVPTLFSSPVVAALVTFILTRVIAEVGQLPQSKTGVSLSALRYHAAIAPSTVPPATIIGVEPVIQLAAQLAALTEAHREHLAYDHGIDADGSVYPAMIRIRSYGLTVLPADAQPST